MTDFFFGSKKFAKIIFKIFFFSKLTEFQPNFFLIKIIFKIFFEFFFLKNFFIEFFWRKFFFSQKYFCEDFFHNILANFFCIWCLRNNVFCEIIYSKFCLLRIFLCCNFGVRKKNCKIFLRFFFSDEREYQIWKCFFSEKKVKFSLIVLLGFLYSLLGK